MTGKMATIVGINGGFGRMFAQKLHSDGWVVAGIDLAVPGSDEAGRIAGSNTILMDENSSSPEADQWLGQSSLLALCVPTAGALWWIHHAAKLLPVDSLCLDILSIKTEVTRQALLAGFAGEYLSLHPMFAPRGVFEGMTMGLVRVKDGPLTDEFSTELSNWGCHLVSMNADDHDKASAVMQAGVHAILLAMGRAASRSGVPKETLGALATPVSGPVSDLITIITDGDPNTYAAIQKENPHARAIRESLIEALKDLGTWSDESDSASFKSMVHEIREGEGPKC